MGPHREAGWCWLEGGSRLTSLLEQVPDLPERILHSPGTLRALALEVLQEEGRGCTHQRGCPGERGARASAYRGDVLEELVGVAEACRRDHRGTGRQGPRHEVWVLDPQVGAEHPPVAGAVAELARGTPSAPSPSRETRQPLSVQAVWPTPTSSAFPGPPAPCPPGPDTSKTHRSSEQGQVLLLGRERRH